MGSAVVVGFVLLTILASQCGCVCLWVCVCGCVLEGVGYMCAVFVKPQPLQPSCPCTRAAEAEGFML